MTFEQAVNEVTEAIERRTCFVPECPCISCDLIREAMAILRAEAVKLAQPNTEVAA